MGYTLTGINMLVAACDRQDIERRITAMEDQRTAMYAEDKDYRKFIGTMRRSLRKPRG